MAAKETKISGKKQYLIAYHFLQKDGSTGIGEMKSYIDSNIKIDNSVVENWREYLKNEYDFEKIIFLNIMNLDNL